MSFRKTIKNKFGVDLPIKGGFGTSIESPIIIDETQKYNYVSLEKTCINYACQIEGKKWVMEKQELIDHEGKYIDVIIIGISTNGGFENSTNQTIFYFDISECINYNLNNTELNNEW